MEKGQQSNPIRLYIIAPTFLPWIGGAEMQALAHGRSLRERGFTTTVITPCFEKSWPRYEMMDGVEVIRVAGGILGGREKYPRVLQKALYLLAVLLLSWTLWRKRHHYDVLHLYHLGLFALPVGLVCRLSGKPLIISIRCAETEGYVPGRQFQSDERIPVLQPGEQARREGDLEGLEKLGKPIVQYTRRLLQRIGARVILLSSRMKGYLVEHEFTLSQMLLIPNGVDTQRFAVVQEDSPDQKRQQTVVCVSKLRYQKGLDCLLHAWRLVQQQQPEARLIIVGDGPLLGQLEQIAHALGIGETVEFAGLQRDIPAQLHRGAIGVLPSYWEGMPNALLEAMACGLACVATRVSGSEDIIEHEINGLLVEPGDHEELATSLLRLLSNKQLVKQYGDVARQTIENHYSLDHVTKTYVKLYHTIVGRLSDCNDSEQTPELSMHNARR